MLSETALNNKGIPGGYLKCSLQGIKQEKSGYAQLPLAQNMIDLIQIFNKKGVLFKSLTEPAFDTTSANGKFIIQIFGAVAEFERNLISERTKVGLEGAKRRNKHLGRPKGASVESIEKYQFAKHLYDNKNIPIDKACKQAGISKATFYRIDKEKQL